ncbi:general odorant-binding protein 19d-like [Sitodiplosis mosellana]|uniref:general odorant-binding protein 19d-like n=1 Tax=Sitodiplosis mosellana TaxID=263140 RepID=UPI0024441D88|nr:general odorant-binding protein 19d-like [Sitodiplosis mosellana]
MKAFYSIVILSVLFAVCMAKLTPEQRRELEAKLLSECKGPSGATDDDVKGLREHEVPKTTTGKCLLSCTQEKLGILVDGKLSIDGLKALGAKKHEGNDKAIATFNEIVAECENISDSDACELGAKLMECMLNGAVKRGIDPKEGIQD